MNFKRDFLNIEQNGALKFTHEDALLGAMEGSSDWRNHVANCDSAKAMFLSIGGEKIVVNDKRSKLFDDELWRRNLEEKAKSMLEFNREGLVKKPEILKSENFTVGSSFDTEQYQKQLLSVGCMCGMEVKINSPAMEDNYFSAQRGNYVSPKNIGKMSYD